MSQDGQDLGSLRLHTVSLRLPGRRVKRAPGRISPPGNEPLLFEALGFYHRVELACQHPEERAHKIQTGQGSMDKDKGSKDKGASKQPSLPIDDLPRSTKGARHASKKANRRGQAAMFIWIAQHKAGTVVLA